MRLFLSYNRHDSDALSQIQAEFERRGVATFFDRKSLDAGLPWPQGLEQGLNTATGVLVFLGGAGLGIWQKREMYLALDLQAEAERQNRRFPVVPVLLNGAEVTSGFLFLNTWIDLRNTPPGSEATDRLIAGLEGTDAANEPPAICPYRGLRPFREEDAGLYFGREAFSQKLAEKTLQRAVTAIVGPSGTGKSSLVQAGLTPLLRRLKSPEPVWEVVTFSPGANPWRRMSDALLPLLPEGETAGDLAADLNKNEGATQSALDRLLRHSSGSDRVLIVVDQLEELLTAAEVNDAHRFLTELFRTTKDPRARLLFTIRADFYNAALTFSRELADFLQEGQVNLGPLTRSELRTAIEEPARKVRFSFEPNLVDRILDDVGQEPGNLPLLEYALTEIWKSPQGRVLTASAYDDVGRVARAIGKRAESVYSGLPVDEQRAAKKVFTRLVRVGDNRDPSTDTRQRVRRKALGEDPALWRVVEKFAAPATWLLVLSRDPESPAEETVEVAHETLIRVWDRLGEWIAESREFLLWRQELAVRMAPYFRSKRRDPGMLLQGALLRQAQHWKTERAEELNLEELKFISDSLRASRRKRTLNYALASLGVVLIAIILIQSYGGEQDASLLQAVLQFFKPKPPADRPPSAARDAAFSVLEIAKAYDFPTEFDGKGQAIGLIELGGGFSQADLKHYFSTLGLPLPAITSVSVDGGKNSPGDINSATQVTGEIEVAGGVAPGAKFIAYFAPNTFQGLQDAVTRSVHDAVNKPSIILIDWGGPEQSFGPIVQSFNDSLRDAASNRVTVVASSGDEGATVGVQPPKLAVGFPASSPWVLACGGTRLTLNKGGSQILSEVVWNRQATNMGASGGGVSVLWPLPDWQQRTKVQLLGTNRTGRAIPDVAADADPDTGYRLFVSGQTMVIGGTSMAAPLWAGLIALINQGLGYNVGHLNPVLYTKLGPEGVFHPITQGNNSVNGIQGYSAGPGWNAVTGWGTPDGRKILAALKTVPH